MTEIKALFDKWISSPVVDEDTKKELYAAASDEGELKERFYRELEFGTAGLRGIIGAGTNRMNIYTVRKATQGLAMYIESMGSAAKERGVAIAYDSRLYSDVFALEAAKVLAASGIKSYLFDELRPTPELSFTVRHLNCIAGIIITASHNPAKYNGYKVYGEDGAQMAPEIADRVLANINSVDIFDGVRVMDEIEAKSGGYITMIGKEVDEAYLSAVIARSINKDIVSKVSDELEIVYTPFHGAGNKLVRKILRLLGAAHVHVVPEQEEPDPKFSTVKSPNPEDPEGFVYAIRLANEVGSDLIIGTDPDGDRVGVMVKNHKGEFIPVSGNQMGVLLVNYVLSQRHANKTLPDNAVVVKTIVTTELTDRVCEKYGVQVRNVLTGFKFIGEIIKNLEEKGEEDRYVFGFEESYGYLSGTYARDKDAVVSSMLIAEMAAWYHTRGMTIYDGLYEIFEEQGYYKELQKSITLEGMEGVRKIAELVSWWREAPPAEINGVEISYICDYSKGIKKYSDGKTEEILLPRSNVLEFGLCDKTKFIIRPSGTEPKLKFYFFADGKTEAASQKKLDLLSGTVLDTVNNML